MSCENCGSEYPPVRVHLIGSDIPVGPAPGRVPVGILHTVYLTAQTPVAQVCGKDPARRVAICQAVTNDVVLGASKALAASSEGAILPHSNTAPTPVPGTGELWAYAATTPAQVSVVEWTEAPQERG